jgi:hypothetical protein
MAVRASNRAFALWVKRLQVSLQNVFWTAFVSLVATINDRILPEGRGIDAEAVAAGCRQFLADCDPGPQQYRGLPLDPAAQALQSQLRVERYWYRGRPIDLQPQSNPLSTPAYAAERPYEPFYQRRLRRWIAQSRWTDRDRSAETPELVQNFRGRTI